MSEDARISDHHRVHIYELHYPGTRPVELDDEASQALTCLLSLMERGVAEAAVSLHFFEEARHDMSRHRPQPPSVEEWERARTLEQSVEARLMSQLAADLTPEQRWVAQNRVRDEARQEVKRQIWREGEWPDAYRHTIPFLYAKSFLYAVDAVAQALATMTTEPWAPETINGIASEWQNAFPTVRAVRNTSQHEDERALGRRFGGKQIHLQPIDSGMIHAPEAGVTVLSNLNGNRFGCTMADGHFGEVEVSAPTLEAVGSLAQGTINCFSWEGPGRFAPY